MNTSLSSEQASTSTYSYLTLRYLIDEDREIDLPVAVALCDREKRQIYFRLPHSGERIPRVPLQKALPSLELIKSKIENWLETGNVPYGEEEVAPLSEAWWKQIRDLMQFRIRIGSVHPIDCHRPAEEIESLYEAVVKPEVAPAQRAKRVDGVVSQALGDRLAQHLEYSSPVPGFKKRPVKVMRHLIRDNQALIVEAINLAATTAEADTFALAGKLRNIQRNPDLNTEFVLGYVASPSGLNGEADLKEFLEQETRTHLFDLTRQPNEFRNQVAQAIIELPGGDALLSESTFAAAA